MKYLNLLRFLFLSFVALVLLDKLAENTSAAKGEPMLVSDTHRVKEPIVLIGE